VDPAAALLYAAFWVVGIAVQVLIILVVCQKAWEAEAPTALPARETATAAAPRRRLALVTAAGTTRRTGTRALARAQIAAAATSVRRFNPRSRNLTREATRELVPCP